ncbi:hypothetical protein M885DRAFT_514377 [Pelagophyceae sp. CCMP2097]|nr:hypothetical protein M885DRAFT_514377 [Pelagophyceae sp. CCMP2097]
MRGLALLLCACAARAADGVFQGEPSSSDVESSGSSSDVESSVVHGPFVHLEHVNLNAANFADAAAWYLSTLGLAADPRAAAVLAQTNAARSAVGAMQMPALLWANCGFQQIHVPVGDALGAVGTAQTLPGRVSLVYSPAGFEALRARLRFDGNAAVLQGVHGNVFEVRAARGDAYVGPGRDLQRASTPPALGTPSECLGIDAVRFDVRTGAAAGICRFYRTVVGAASARDGTAGGAANCVIRVGSQQQLVFTEVGFALAAYDGHHIAVYTMAFDDMYHRVQKRGLVFNNPRFPQFTYDSLHDARRWQEFRFKDIVDPDTGELLHQLEHEVRSLEHPAFAFKDRAASVARAATTAATAEL